MNAKIDAVFGTHALIEESVQFSQLGLTIVDEQHRFGVLQRGALKEKARIPHMLVMSATPIPRTLALTFYGDLDVSEIREMPKGRKPVITKVFYNEDERAYTLTKEETLIKVIKHISFALLLKIRKLLRYNRWKVCSKN